MERTIKYYLILLWLGMACPLMAQSNVDSEKVHLYTDRSYCLSGDTLWFKVWLPKSLEEKSNVVRVQLNSARGSFIASVAQQSDKQWAEGFIHIPDSLSTGIYLVLAYVNEQRNRNLELKSKTLLVYNRFEEQLSEIDVPENELIDETNRDAKIDISTVKKVFGTREKVEGTITIPEGIKHATLSAKLVDPLSDLIPANLKIQVSNEQAYIPGFPEKDGILISGRVLSHEDIPQKDVLVFLSISSEPPYFDYCISHKQGGFNFFLPEARGTADLVLQAIAPNRSDLLIVPETNQLKPGSALAMESTILNPQQSEFIEKVVQANFIKKLFKPARVETDNTFEMPQRFSVPYYGKPGKRVTPNEFFDLPDFREISREILPGVQYRTREGTATLRILNADRGNFFANESLRLLNGIPVFKNSLFSPLQSTDINYIDIVEEERVFGDLVFNGVFAVSLHDKSNSWLAQQAQIFQFKVPCLQVNRDGIAAEKPETDKKVPDIRQTYFWEILPDETSSNFRFCLSDLKGKVEITVEGITDAREAFKTSKIIEVK